MSKLQILLTLVQLFGPVVFKEAWPTIRDLLNILKSAPQQQIVMGRAMAKAREERVGTAQREELLRMAEEAGVPKEEVEAAIR